MRHIDFTIEFLSDWHLGTGRGRHGHLDRTYDRDERGLPFVGAKSLKGVIRLSMERIAAGLDDGAEGGWTALTEWLLGSQPTVEQASGIRRRPVPGALLVGRAELDSAVAGAVLDRPALRRALTVERPGVMLDELGVAADDHLRFVEMAPVGLVLHGRCSLPDDAPDAAVALVVAALGDVSRIGHRRRRGWGSCRITTAGFDGDISALLGSDAPAAPSPDPVHRPTPAAQPTTETTEWQEYSMVLRALSPLLLPAGRAGNDLTSRITVPGASLLALLGGIAPDATRAGVVDGSLRVGEGLPVLGGKVSLPVPLSWFRYKEQRSGKPTEVLDRLSAVVTSAQQVQIRRGFVVPGSEPGSALLGEPRTERRLHVSIDDATQSAQDGALFSYTAVVPGTVYACSLLLTSERAEALAREAGAADLRAALMGEHRVGASRRNEYGRVLVESVSPVADAATATSPGDGSFTVWLTSDMLPLDDSLVPLPTVEGVAAMLSAELGRSVVVQQALVRRVRREGWHGRWGLPRPSLVGVAAGSVLRCAMADGGGVPRADVARLGRLGCGDRTAEGFGRFVVDHPLLTAATVADAPPTRPSSGPPTASVPGSADALSALEDRAWQLFISDRVAAAVAGGVHRNRLSLAGAKPGRSQLGALRSAARNDAGDLAEVRAWWHTMLGVARRANRWPNSVRQEIEHLLEQPTTVWALLDVDDEIGATWWGTRWPSSKTDRAPQAVLALLTAATRASQRDGAGRDTVEDSE
jgi:CRISPR-associated protein Csx10